MIPGVYRSITGNRDDDFFIGGKAISKYLGLRTISEGSITWMPLLNKGAFVLHRYVAGHVNPMTCAFRSQLDMAKYKVFGTPIPPHKPEQLIIGFEQIAAVIFRSVHVVRDMKKEMDMANVLLYLNGRAGTPTKATTPCSFPSLLKAFIISREGGYAGKERIKMMRAMPTYHRRGDIGYLFSSTCADNI
jgi:hypothetical protein